MKRTIIVFLLCLVGMTIFAQSGDMSYYTREFNRADATFVDRLAVLETIRNANLTGIGEFYHDALKLVLIKTPGIRNKEDRDATDESAIIICRGLAAEKYNAAAADLWQAVQYFDIINVYNQGHAMQEALDALGQIGATEFLPHIVHRLTDLNTNDTSDVETKRRVQRAVVGAIRALEAFHDIAGFRPVFFVSTGWYDPSIKAMASVALPNILDDPGEIVSEIIRDTSVIPEIKYMAWREMLRTRAPNSSKAQVAAAALATGWYYSTPNLIFQRYLREMRMSAIDTIRVMGASDDSVYADLERSYNNNFINTVPDYDEIRKTLDCLGALRTDGSGKLLLKFLRELHERRRNGPWGNKERQILGWVVPSIGETMRVPNSITDEELKENVRLLLTTIQRASEYTGTEQTWARNALRQMD